MENNTKYKHRDYSAEWLHLLVESALDAVITMDSGGRIIAFNPAAENIFGHSREKVIGKRVSDLLIPPKFRTFHEKGLREHLRTGAQKIIGKRIQVTALRADGDEFPIELEVVTVKESSNPVFMAYIRDISERILAFEEKIDNYKKIKKILLQTVLAVSKALEIRDPYTAGHQKRVAHLATAMAQELQLDEERIEGIFFGALIHDIGKIAIPAEILTRPGKLSREDEYYLKTHCIKGYEILKAIEYPWPIAEIALQHHEHLDGSGYPQGLTGSNILIEAKIISIADVVEALTSHRPYRPAISLEEALFIIRSKAGRWFDKKAVMACLSLFKRGYRIDDADFSRLPLHTSL